MFKVILAFSLLVACSGSETPATPTKAVPMLQGACVDRVVPNLFGRGTVSYQECRWRRRVWVCRLEIDSYAAFLRAVQTWRCVAVAEETNDGSAGATRTGPEAPAAADPKGPTS